MWLKKFMNDNNSESFAAYFAKPFTLKSSPQQCRKIMCFGILSTVKPIGSMKTWSKSSCTLFMKYRIEIIDNSRCRYSQIINAWSEVYRACRHIPGFHRFTQHWWSSDRWKVANFEFSKLIKKKNCFQLVEKHLEKENIWTLGMLFIV